MMCAATRGIVDAQENGCGASFTGHARADAKNRPSSAGSEYDILGANQALTLSDFFKLTCERNKKLPPTVGLGANAITGIETTTVTVKGYLLAVKWEVDDNDLHVQLGPKKQWTTGQLVVEIPAGMEFCDSRTTVYDLVAADIAKHGGKSIQQGHLLRDKTPVQVTGYLFFDGAHGSSANGCTKNGNRGLRGPLASSPVRGLWEIHPVVGVRQHE
jgi:hypothetical protein